MALLDSQQPVIAIVAGEASGDLLGADIIVSLKKYYPNATFVGIGGERMLAEGFQSWYPMERLSIMGIFEVLKHLFSLLKLRKELISKLILAKPDFFIGIDAPDFNFKVEEALKKAGIFSVHYVGPSVWAWREGRLNTIKHQIDGMLVLFPFEEPYYHKHNIPVKFVGHPLASQILEEDNTLQSRLALGLAADSQVTGILPGSRYAEVNLMIDIYIQVAMNILNEYPKMIFIIPCVNTNLRGRIESAIQLHASAKVNNFKLFDKQSELVIEASDQLMVTSGTAVLEVGLHNKPQLLAIQINPFSYWLMKRLIKIPWVGLPNILAKKEVVKEFIQHEATVQNIYRELRSLIIDEDKRQAQITIFKQQHQLLKQNASDVAALTIINWLKEHK